MMHLQGKSVVLCVTGGIAAYKAADLTSRLKKKGAEVFIVMTKSATEFITPLTLEVLSGNRVIVDMFNRDFPWEVEHISLAKRADVFVLAPATANGLSNLQAEDWHAGIPDAASWLTRRTSHVRLSVLRLRRIFPAYQFW